jgi:hypothetical protein
MARGALCGSPASPTRNRLVSPSGVGALPPGCSSLTAPAAAPRRGILFGVGLFLLCNRAWVMAGTRGVSRAVIQVESRSIDRRLVVPRSDCVTASETRLPRLRADLPVRARGKAVARRALARTTLRGSIPARQEASEDSLEEGESSGADTGASEDAGKQGSLRFDSKRGLNRRSLVEGSGLLDVADQCVLRSEGLGLLIFIVG